MTKTIGKYAILNELGRGAMGIVFRALDPSIERYVALKVIRTPDFGSQEETANLRMRLVREARAAGRLTPPCIAAVYNPEENAHSLYVVMEFVDGQSLEKHAASGNVSSPGETIHILRQIAEALDYAHSMGIVHRDIKPANILVAPGG